jgi:alginate O-acetyltransferase complex protein AlgJ
MNLSQFSKPIGMLFGALFLVCNLTSAQNNLVIRGIGDWLYFHEEWFSQVENEKKSVENIIKIVTAFKTQNIPIVVALTPAKSRIYSEYLQSGDLPKKEIQVKYTNTIELLQSAQVPVIDLYSWLLSAKKAATIRHFPLYFRQDSHWSKTGGLLAGQEVARFIRLNYAERIKSIPEQQFQLNMLPISRQLGDLTKFLSESERQIFLPEPYEPYELLPLGEATGSDLFSDFQPEVVLVGSSYSLPGTGFEDGIRLALSKNTLNYSLGGQGQWEPVHQFLTDAIQAKTLPKLVIWEIPERFLFYTPTAQVLKQILENILKLPKPKK